MTNAKSNLGICYFVNQVNSLIHETTKMFYRFRTEYPIDDPILEKCSLLSAAFYCRRKGILPNLSILADLGMEKEETEEVLFFYERFSDDAAECFSQYASEVETLIEESAQRKGFRGYIMIPQFAGKRREIENCLAFQSGGEFSKKREKKAIL